MLPCPSTWSVSSPRRPVWSCVLASRLEHRPTHGTRCQESVQSSVSALWLHVVHVLILLPTLLCLQIVDELREEILKLRFPHRVQNKETTPKTKRKAVAQPSPSKCPPNPAAKSALSDRPCVVVLNKPLEKLLIRSDPREGIFAH